MGKGGMFARGYGQMLQGTCYGAFIWGYLGDLKAKLLYLNYGSEVEDGLIGGVDWQ
jgi:hypothetical protein